MLGCFSGRFRRGSSARSLGRGRFVNRGPVSALLRHSELDGVKRRRGISRFWRPGVFDSLREAAAFFDAFWLMLRVSF
jgi:hypothetical protein